MLAKRVRWLQNEGFGTIFALRSCKDRVELVQWAMRQLRYELGLRSAVSFLSSPQEERAMGTVEMPLSKFGADLFWWIFGGLQNAPLRFELLFPGSLTAASCSSVLPFHWGHTFCLHLWLAPQGPEGSPPLENTGCYWSLSSFTRVGSAWQPAFQLPAFQLPVAPFSVAYCSPLDRCLLWQVPFLPYGFLCSQADKLFWGRNLQSQPKNQRLCLSCMHETQRWYPLNIPQSKWNFLELKEEMIHLLKTAIESTQIGW